MHLKEKERKKEIIVTNIFQKGDPGHLVESLHHFSTPILDPLFTPLDPFSLGSMDPFSNSLNLPFSNSCLD